MLGDFPSPSTPGRHRGAAKSEEKEVKERGQGPAVRTGLRGYVLKTQTDL